jgi:hypothetical protein
MTYNRGAQFFQKPYSLLKITGARRVTRSKIHSDDTKMLVPPYIIYSPWRQGEWDLCTSDLHQEKYFPLLLSTAAMGYGHYEKVIFVLLINKFPFFFTERKSSTPCSQKTMNCSLILAIRIQSPTSNHTNTLS